MGAFEECDEFVAGWEGGNVDHPKDPGGRTSRGVTQRVYNEFRNRHGEPGRDVYQMTEDERKSIYRQLYWEKVKAGLLAPGFDIVVYDPAVNSGPARGVKWFQAALASELKAPVTVDGGMGPKTLSVANSAFAIDNGDVLIKKACANRFGFLRALKTWSTFGKGWSRRVVALEAFAVRRWAEGRGGNARQVLEVEAATARAEAKSGLRTAGGTGAAGGGVGATDALPLELAIPLGIALLAVVAYLIWRSSLDKKRSQAYEKEAKK